MTESDTETELYFIFFLFVLCWWQIMIWRKGLWDFKKQHLLKLNCSPDHNRARQLGPSVLDKRLTWIQKKYFSCLIKTAMMEGAFRQIAEPDAPMKQHTGNQEWVCQISLSTVIWQRHAPCSLSEAHNFALVLTSYTLHCFKTKPKAEPMTTNWPYAGNIKLLPPSKTCGCFLM